eukprot:514417-Prorocentrum_minimum.AAC.2
MSLNSPHSGKTREAGPEPAQFVGPVGRISQVEPPEEQFFEVEEPAPAPPARGKRARAAAAEQVPFFHFWQFVCR